MSDNFGYTDPASLQQEAAYYANLYGVPENLFQSVIQGESGFNPYAVNPQSGAAGLGQVLPSTAANPGYGIAPLTNPLDPNSNLSFAAQYLSALYQKLGTWIGAVAAYAGAPAGSLPYAGNNQQNNIVSAALAADQAAVQNGTAPAPTNTAFNPATGTTAPTQSMLGGIASAISGVGTTVSGLLPKLVTGLESLLEQGGALLLGIVIIGAAIYLFSQRK